MEHMKDSRRQLVQMVTGYWISQAIHVAAKLRLADLLADGPRASNDLAVQTNTHPRSLHRLLRALASVGVFRENAAGQFETTELSDHLRDEPGSLHPVALMMGDEHFHSWGDLLHSVRTGQPAFDQRYGKPIFDFLSENPARAQVFDAAMTGFHGPETAAMVAAYDFSEIETLVDVGGGNGTVLRAVLRRYPRLRGILYDLPGVIERARQQIEQDGLADRCQTRAGSFFESSPAGGDVYLMRHIIHDWNDEQCGTILKHIRRVIPKTGRLLIIEMVIQPGNEQTAAKFLDLNMLVLPGGMERTADEYRELLARSGFRLDRIVPTPTEVSVVEATPA